MMQIHAFEEMMKKRLSLSFTTMNALPKDSSRTDVALEYIRGILHNSEMMGDVVRIHPISLGWGPEIAAYDVDVTINHRDKSNLYRFCFQVLSDEPKNQTHGIISQ